MRPCRSLLLVLAAMLLGIIPACRSHRPPADPALEAELAAQPYLFAIVRHLYRWHLTEADVEKIASQKHMTFWIRRHDARLDPGDRSSLAEIVLPHIGMSVQVKKADYVIEETGTHVRNDGYKIMEVRRSPASARPPDGSSVVRAGTQEMIDFLFRTRSQKDFAAPALVDRMRRAVREEVARESLAAQAPAGSPVVHLAPLSPVANETWVYWEAGRKLFHFSSDHDLIAPASWEERLIAVRIHDLDSQVVLSREEAPGSNRFLTRLEASRALFNCIVLGQRVALPESLPPGTAPAGATAPRH